MVLTWRPAETVPGENRRALLDPAESFGNGLSALRILRYLVLSNDSEAQHTVMVAQRTGMAIQMNRNTMFWQLAGAKDSGLLAHVKDVLQ